MSTSRHVHEVMSTPVVSVTPDVTLGHLATILVGQRIGAVPVVDEDGRALGVVAEADLARRTDVSGTVLTAADVMSAPPATIGAHADVDDALRSMQRLGVGRLPVLDASGRVVGIVSGSDLRAGGPRARRIADPRIRRRVIDRVIDAGGEVLEITVDEGAVRVHIRIGARGEIPLIEHMLAAVPGVTRLELTADPIDGAGRYPNRRGSRASA